MGTLLNALVGALRFRTSVLTYSVIRDFFTCKVALVEKKKKKKKKKVFHPRGVGALSSPLIVPLLPPLQV